MEGSARSNGKKLISDCLQKMEGGVGEGVLAAKKLISVFILWRECGKWREC